MNAKDDLKLFATKWPRRHRTTDCLAEPNDVPPIASRTFSDVIEAKQEMGLQHRDCLQRQLDQLHDEIKRGKEYLRRVQKELGDTQACLEQWNSYEMISSAHPLDDLIQTMALQEKTRQFLVHWLTRKHKKVAKVAEAIECASGKNHRNLK